MTTRDKLEFTFLMGRHSTATIGDCQRLLRFAAAYQRTFHSATGRRHKIAARIAHICAGIFAEAVYDAERVAIVSKGNVIQVPV